MEIYILNLDEPNKNLAARLSDQGHGVYEAAESKSVRNVRVFTDATRSFIERQTGGDDGLDWSLILLPHFAGAGLDKAKLILDVLRDTTLVIWEDSYTPTPSELKEYTDLGYSLFCHRSKLEENALTILGLPK